MAGIDSTSRVLDTALPSLIDDVDLILSRCAAIGAALCIEGEHSELSEDSRLALLGLQSDLIQEARAQLALGGFEVARQTAAQGGV